MTENILKNDSRIQKAIEHLSSVMIEGEKIESIAVQQRIYTIFPFLFGNGLIPHRRQIIAATSGRLIWMKRNIISGYDILDFRWQDIGEVFLQVGIFGSDLKIKFYNSTDLSLNKNYGVLRHLIGFNKSMTQAIYRIVQFQDQSWREKRRIRGLEELRAKSGGINVGNQLKESSPPTDNENNIQKLKQAKQLLDENLISDSEYETIKAKIISSI